ncbi:hypothetical protein JKF63_03345 [Porcisia hertigi]|uniref:Uncharacterized protein n=1 Tax=Porcisia hertigi TaxID=2761500 RepID=A0A836L780_9TRYP|nr:hypothetical protein JKF63_03345 [Porcisia hertigi]
MNTADPYSLSPQKGAVETTLFQALFPTHESAAIAQGVVGHASLATTPRDISHKRVVVALARPSPSASERIRAWELFPEEPVARSFSGTEDGELDIHEGATLLHDTDAPQLSDGNACSSTVPFSAHLRETERRFREQMEVHRGLTAASRQIDVLERSVQAFRAQRRTRALTQALAERQAAIWARVWPGGGGSPLTMSNTAATVHGETGVLASPLPAAAAKKGDNAITPSVTNATSPLPPPASATSSLLKEILSTYSKPHEARGNSGATGTPATSAPVVPHALEAKRGAPLASTHEARRTATGVEIVRPEAAPKPYAVIRYMAARSKQVSGTHDAVDRRSRSTSASVGKPAAATTPSAASSERTPKAEEGDSREFSSVVEDEHVGKASNQSSSGVADEAVSAEDTYNAETSNSHTSHVSTVYDVMNRTKSTLTNTSISTEEATSRVLSHSTASEKSEGRPAARRLGSQHRGSRKRSGTSVVEDAQATPFADVLRGFFDACRWVSGASAQLLASPYIQERHDKAGWRRRHTPQRAINRFSNRASSAVVNLLKAEEKRKDGSCVSLGAADSADVAADTWREALQRQLRNVRLLQRFRARLLSNLERIDVQRQAHLQATQLLQETQALAKIRSKLLSAPTAAGEACLNNMLRHVKMVFKGTGEEGSHPRCAGRKQSDGKRRGQHPSSSRPARRVMSEQDTISELLDTNASSAISEDVMSAGSVIVDEVMHGSEESNAVLSESIQEEVSAWDEASEYSEVASGVSTTPEGANIHGDAVDASYGSDSFVAASSINTAGRAAWMTRSGIVAEVGLDEIEEELADRLAEMSSNAFSKGSPIPSDVEDLVDLLPSSPIPSELDSDTTGPQGDSASTAASSILTDMTSSTAAVQVQQRRMYVGAKGSIARYTAAVERAAGGGAGALMGHKAYICDSPGSSMYSVPGDADVDTSILRSTDIRSEDLPDSSWERSEGAADFDAPTLVVVSSRRQSQGSPSHIFLAKSDESSSGSDDALAALELDMNLTKERRRAALCCARDVPSFEQLYNPCVSPLGKGTPSTTNTTNTTSSGDSSCSSAPDYHETELAHGDIVVETGPAGFTSRERTAVDVGSHVIGRSEASTQAEVGGADSGPVVVPGASQVRVAYPMEDHVAQSAWKARQLHLLQQLRPPVEDKPEDATKDSVDAALDAAEAAAREEWAQHWGVLESLLQTRFSVSCSAHGDEPPPCSPGGKRLLCHRLSSDSTPSSRDASLSSVATAPTSR